MREIKKLNRFQLKDALTVAVKAYPMMKITTEQQFIDLETRLLEDFEQDSRVWYGLYEDGKLLGSMMLYDFIMNYYGKDVKARGIGFVAVDLLHKKQKVAYDMLQWYLNDSLKKKYPLAILYSFRPDFYKKMGFGFGTYCFNYAMKPNCFPKEKSGMQMLYLNAADQDDIIAFYESLYEHQHGMIRKKSKDIENLFKAPGLNIAGYREDGVLKSLVIFRMKSDETTNQTTHLFVDLLFSNSSGLKVAMSFLNSQSDQVSEIYLSTPHKDFFFNLNDIRHNDGKILKDPGFHHIYDTGMGMMYRSLDPVNLLIAKPCTLDNFKIRFVLNDDFMVNCAKDVIIEWKKGKTKQVKSGKYDVELRMDVSDFSSWILNVIDLTTLYNFGLVQMSDELYLPVLEHAFYYQQKPVCLERF